jgi:hypothetical protein
MLSKCLNPHCSAKFRYLWQGRLFRIDFAEAQRTCGSAGTQPVVSTRSKAKPVEHFWLCGVCAATMTIGLNEAGEVRVVPFATQKLGPEPVPQTNRFVANAS